MRLLLLAVVAAQALDPALIYWVAACLLVIVLPALGAPLLLVVVTSLPFAVLAGWHFAGHPLPHECGWCGRRFGGAYDWICPTCARDYES